MRTYLIKKCQGCTEHPCLNSHQGQVQRRIPILYTSGVWNYKPILCSKQICPYKELCLYSHTQEEVDFHPLIYKTTECKNPSHTGRSINDGINCSFAHGDIRSKPTFSASIVFNVDTFKIHPCNITTQHNHKICDKYHQKRDKRRDLKIFMYSTVPCKNIECQDDFCEFAHNEFEILYHQDFYKTELCSFNPCSFAAACPYLHDEEYKQIEELLVKKELNELNDKMKMLEKLVEAEELKNKEFERYKCVNCAEKASEAVLKCGHLVCLKCIEMCKVCGTEPVEFVLVKDINE